MCRWLTLGVLNSFSIVISVYVSISWSPITLGNYFAFWDIQKMIDRGYVRCNPIAGPFVVLDLAPVVIFKVELDGEVCTFETEEVSNVVTNFQPGSILQVSSGNILVPPSSNWHSGLEIFSQCHIGEVQLNVTTRQVILLNLSSISGSTKHKFTMLVRSNLCDKVLILTYTLQ